MAQNEVLLYSPTFGTATNPCTSSKTWKPNHQLLHPGPTKSYLKIMNVIGWFGFSFLVAVLLQTDLNSVADWQTKSKEFKGEKDEDQHLKPAGTGRSLFTAYTLTISRRTPLGMLCSWRWQHLQRHSLNNSQCKNLFTSFKWILKSSEKQVKEAGKEKKVKPMSCSQ